MGKRRQDPAGEALTGHGTGLELHELRYGDDHRGATWFHTDNGVVWLLAYGRHRSGDPEDVYPYMEELGKSGHLLPDEDDYEALFDDRGVRPAEVAPAQAAELLDAARGDPGVEHRGVLGAEVEAAEVGVVVEVAETLEEIAVAFSLDQVPAGWVTLIPAWFVPESSWDQWRTPATIRPAPSARARSAGGTSSRTRRGEVLTCTKGAVSTGSVTAQLGRGS